MPQAGHTLRVVVLGVKAQKPRRYYLRLQTLAPGHTAAASLPASSHAAESSSTDHQQVCCTETSSLSSCPEFANRVFLLRLPAPVSSNSSSNDAAGGPRVAVTLLAAPSLDDPAPQIIAGQEVDPVVASGHLELSGDVAARLAAGKSITTQLQLQEAAAQNVQLTAGLGGQAAQLQSMRSSTAANVYSSSADTQVLLELMLLDVEQCSQPSSMLMDSCKTMAAAAAAAGDLSEQHRGQVPPVADSSSTAAAAAAEAVLSVLVSAATNVPLVPGPSNQLVAPSAFVALKSAADVAAKRPAQAMTAAAAAGQHPVWSELLSVVYPEAALQQEQLLLAIVSSSNNKVLVKGSLPLSGLIPGHHYNLAVALSDSCVLYITVHLGLGASTQLDALQGSGILQAAASAAGQLKLMQVRLAASIPSLYALAHTALQRQQQQQQQQEEEEEKQPEIWAVWRTGPRLSNSSSSSRTADSRQQAASYQLLHAAVDGRAGHERSAGAVLRDINGRSGLLATAVVGAADDNGDDGSDHVVGALPVCSGGDVQLWPEDHSVLLPVWLSGTVAAELELYLVTYPVGNSSNDTSSSSRSKQQEASQQPVQRPQIECFARLQLPCSALAKQQSGLKCSVRDLVVTAVGAAAKQPAAVAKAAVEVTTWQVEHYLQHLKQIAASVHQSLQANCAVQQLSAAVVAGNSAFSQSLHLGATAVSDNTLLQQAVVRNNSLTVETLVGDLFLKQQALEKVQRAVNVSENRREIAVLKVADLQDKNSRLTSDLQHLRQLLHDEKAAAAAALDGSSIAALAAKNPSKDELLQQLGIAAAAQAKERTRNAELVHRLQQLHAEQIDVVELQKRFAELQEAHFQQGLLLADQETNVSTIQTLKTAVKDQETVITRLEKLLAAAASRAKELEGWKTSADAWEAEAARLRGELARLAAARPADDLAQMASKAAAAVAEQQAAAASLAEREAAAAAALADYELKLAAKESDRLSAMMRVEKAEAAATAAHNELLDVTKRYAREVAQLKTRLAEKDAQLLGGFGSLANLQLGELGTLASTTNLYPSHTAATAAGIALGDLSSIQLPPNPAILSGPMASGSLSPAVISGLGPSWGLEATNGMGIEAFQGDGLDVAPEMQAMMHQQQQQQPPVGQNRHFTGRAAAVVPTGYLPAAAGTSSRTGSPKLEPLSPNTSPWQQQQQQQEVAASNSSSPYNLRAGSAEGALSRRKPGSPLAPLQQQRNASSAEGLRSSGSMNAGGLKGVGSATAAAAGGSSLRRTGSPASVGLSTSAAAAVVVVTSGRIGSPGGGSLMTRSSSGGVQQQQQQQQQPRSPLLSAKYTGDSHSDGLVGRKRDDLYDRSDSKDYLAVVPGSRQESGSLSETPPRIPAVEAVADQAVAAPPAKTGFRRWFG